MVAPRKDGVADVTFDLRGVGQRYQGQDLLLGESARRQLVEQLPTPKCLRSRNTAGTIQVQLSEGLPAYAQG